MDALRTAIADLFDDVSPHDRLAFERVLSKIEPKIEARIGEPEALASG